VRAQQLKQQREDWARQAQEEEKKVVTLSSKVQYNVDFEFTDLDKEVAIEKMTAAAVKVSPLKNTMRPCVFNDFLFREWLQ